MGYPRRARAGPAAELFAHRSVTCAGDRERVASLRMSMKLPPFFYRDESKPERGQFVFGYAVRIENIGREPAQLLRRRWLIHDSIGEDTEVEGEGVIGEQPMIEPGRIHEYRSFCILKSPSGYM